MARGGVDVVADTTGRAEFSDVPGLMNPRGRIILLVGTGRRIDLDQWAFYTRELHLVGFIMSGMTVSELAEAAEWINAQHGIRRLTVSLARLCALPTPPGPTRSSRVAGSRASATTQSPDNTTAIMALTSRQARIATPRHVNAEPTPEREGRARSSRDEP
jgi:hypothetical protein